jgi:small-conductance mechanosensitive channel
MKMMIRNHRLYRRLIGLLMVVLLLNMPCQVVAEEEAGETTGKERNTLSTLLNLVNIKENIEQDIAALSKSITAAESETQKASLKQQLLKLDAELSRTVENFENISAGLDLSSLRSEDESQFDLKQELFSLLKPAIDEMKDMTSKVRQKSELKEDIAYYGERLKVLDGALKNVETLREESDSDKLKESLNTLAEKWRKNHAFMESEYQAAQLQLDEIVASEVSITDASQDYLKQFFQRRGLYLIEAVLVVVVIVLLSRVSYKAMRRLMPGFKKKHRSFRVRLLELVHRVLTTLLIIIGPMVVFYIVEDWVLLSLGILLLLGIVLGLRQALPRYWHQIQLFLNIGSVREGERICLDGLPWRVEQINVYSILQNPDAGITLRVPIDDLVDQKSRPCDPDEPWFPCHKDDWVILSDGVRGKVVGISPEMVQLVERGGAQKTYLTGDFLAASPRNLATNFRIKEVIGVSYGLQEKSTETIPEILRNTLQRRLEQEGYGEQLLNLRVEFAQANSSSLDIVVIADFSGELGDLYNRLRRAIQRWCVDACTENGWEIPFPQMTLSGAIEYKS